MAEFFHRCQCTDSLDKLEMVASPWRTALIKELTENRRAFQKLFDDSALMDPKLCPRCMEAQV